MYIQDSLFEYETDDSTDKEDEVDDDFGPIYLVSNACPACAVGDHSFCYIPLVEEDGTYCCCPEESVSNSAEKSETTIDRIKAASEITDVTSTGRKRAALAYPIEEGMICEWANLAKAGGGVIPVIGCDGNKAVDIHHGPDKNTLNNTPENVHRICANCHNRFHSLNDKFYGKRPSGTEPFIPLDGYKWYAHDAETKATTEMILKSEIYWGSKKRAFEYGSIRGEDTPKVREEVSEEV